MNLNQLSVVMMATLPTELSTETDKRRRHTAVQSVLINHVLVREPASGSYQFLNGQTSTEQHFNLTQGILQ